MKILQVKINEHYRDLKIHDSEIKYYASQLESLPQDLNQDIIKILHEDEQINNNKIKIRQIKKLQGLENSKLAQTKATFWRQEQPISKPPSEWERSKVINQSSYSPSDDEIKVLALGWSLQYILMSMLRISLYRLHRVPFLFFLSLS